LSIYQVLVIKLRKYLLLFLYVSFLFSNETITYKHDQTDKILINKMTKDSQLKVYMPTLPYFNLISLINGTLVKLSDSKRGWDYYLAYKHEKIDELTYDFWLRDDVRYQDGYIYIKVQNAPRFLNIA